MSFRFPRMLTISWLDQHQAPAMTIGRGSYIHNSAESIKILHRGVSSTCSRQNQSARKKNSYVRCSIRPRPYSQNTQWVIRIGERKASRVSKHNIGNHLRPPSFPSSFCVRWFQIRVNLLCCPWKLKTLVRFVSLIVREFVKPSLVHFHP